MPWLHPMQNLIRKSQARFKVVACGRRFGKTYLGVTLCFASALSGGTAWWVSPSYKQSKIAWRIMMRLVKQVPGCRIVQQPDYIIEFPGGGIIQLHTTGTGTSYDSLRGEGLDFLVIDECADVPEEAWTEALYPALMDKLGGALFIGTPKGRNWFWKLWRDAEHDPEWERWQLASHANPMLDRDELRKREIKASNRIWKQEYLAEFVTFEGRVYENFDPAGPMVFHEMDPSIYHAHWGGIDFGFRNPCAFVVGAENAESQIDIVDEHYDDRMKTEDIITHVRELTEKYGVRQWWADAANPQMIDELQDAGLPVEASPRSSGGQETFVQHEVRLVDGLLQEDPPAIRFFEPNTPNCIREHDGYRYAKIREGTQEKESPKKVDDHSCNAVQYLIHGLDEWYGDAGTALLGDARDSIGLPT